MDQIRLPNAVQGFGEVKGYIAFWAEKKCCASACLWYPLSAANQPQATKGWSDGEKDTADGGEQGG